MDKKLKIFLVAGEPSGDLHGAKLMKEIKLQFPEVKFYGIGGEKMTELGLNSFVDIKQISVVGFWEVAKKYIFFKKLLNECKKFILQNEIDLFLPIDYPGFNIALGKLVKKEGIKVYYYIAPQLWAWASFRAKNLKKAIDKLFVILPFEKEFFEKYVIDVSYVGHPLLDDNKFSEPILDFSQRENIIAIFPGSRKQEIIRNLSVLGDIILKIKNELSDYKIGISISNNIDVNIYYNYFKDNNIEINEDKIVFYYNSRELMQKAKFGLIKTGTSNLEAALLGLPFIMYYKASKVNYIIGKNLLNMESVSLVNIIFEQSNLNFKTDFGDNTISDNKIKTIKKDNIITEYIQNLNSNDIIDEIKYFCNNENEFTKFQDYLAKIKEALGNQSASKNLANVIIRDFAIKINKQSN